MQESEGEEGEALPPLADAVCERFEGYLAKV